MVTLWRVASLLAAALLSGSLCISISPALVDSHELATANEDALDMSQTFYEDTFGNHVHSDGGFQPLRRQGKPGAVHLERRWGRRVRSRRSAIVTYTCPVAGVQTRTFKWQVKYSPATDELEMEGVSHVTSWDHVYTSTNDFSTAFNNVFEQMHGHFCCRYRFKVSVLGEVFATHVAMDLTAPDVPATEGVRATENCVDMPENLSCVLIGSTVPRIERDCRATSVVLRYF